MDDENLSGNGRPYAQLIGWMPARRIASSYILSNRRPYLNRYTLTLLLLSFLVACTYLLINIVMKNHMCKNLLTEVLPEWLNSFSNEISSDVFIIFLFPFNMTNKWHCTHKIAEFKYKYSLYLLCMYMFYNLEKQLGNDQ